MKLLVFLISVMFCYSGLAQDALYYKAPLFPEQNSKTKFYTVKGERHGPSFFKKDSFPEVEYKPGEKLTFDIYHTPDVMYHWYRKWAQEYPDITDLYEVARSFEGRPILQMTITNKKTSKARPKGQ